MSEKNTISVERLVDHPADQIFEILTNPERHREWDTSGFVRGDHKSNRIQQVGDVFVMEMDSAAMGGEYRTENHVTGFVQDKLLAWKTAPEGTEPAGWEWMWELEPQGPGATLVRLTYDWSKVTDKALLKRIPFPVLTEKQLEDSLAKLAAVVSDRPHDQHQD